MTRGPRPHQALKDAVPIAKARGFIQLTMSGPERIYDISIVSKIPIAFARVMFAPKILATMQELVGYYEKEIAQLRLIARDAAVTAELWIRSRHGTWRFFLVTPSALVEIDREGKRLGSARVVSYMAGTLAEEPGRCFPGTGADDLSHREGGSVLS
jgi:hypothetical protein